MTSMQPSEHCPPCRQRRHPGHILILGLFSQFHLRLDRHWSSTGKIWRESFYLSKLYLGRFEVLFWGLRDLKRVQFLPVSILFSKLYLLLKSYLKTLNISIHIFVNPFLWLTSKGRPTKGGRGVWRPCHSGWKTFMHFVFYKYISQSSTLSLHYKTMKVKYHLLFTRAQWYWTRRRTQTSLQP